jgi:hypothetical protein
MSSTLIRHHRRINQAVVDVQRQEDNEEVEEDDGKFRRYFFFFPNKCNFLTPLTTRILVSYITEYTMCLDPYPYEWPLKVFAHLRVTFLDATRLRHA